MPLSIYKTKRLRSIFILYWFLLLYIIAALVWWFIALTKQNHQMAVFEISQLKKESPGYHSSVAAILDQEKRKTTQYIGEGAVFFLLIAAGAFVIFRAVLKQFRQGQQQQNLMMAITHELKTPIAVAKLNLETLQKRKLDESQQQRLIQNTIQETNRLNTLCSNILLSSQIETGRHSISKEEINFSQLVQHCANDFIVRYPKRSILTSIAEDLFLQGDHLMLQMAINNLIDNALKYSSKDAAVTISLEGKGNEILLSVADEGKGIEPAEKKKIFDKYYRIGNKATKEAKGTGLGLYLTKKIIQQHKAAIFLKDNIPSGSIFVITFKQES
jgi:two-component system, OmpR family, sensor histidine kinase CiaH